MSLEKNLKYLQVIETKLKEKKVSIKKMLSDLNFSHSLITQWRKGNTPSLDKFTAIAEYLDVPVDYLLGNIEVKITKEILPNEKNAIFAAPQRLAALRSGVSVSGNMRLKIGRYMNCSQDYLYGYEYSECEADNDIEYSGTEVVFQICNILDQCAADDKYKILQLQISRLIARNIEQKYGITYQMLLDRHGIERSKLDLIYNISADMSGYGFNLSDIFRIMDDFTIMPSDMFRESK